MATFRPQRTTGSFFDKYDPQGAIAKSLAGGSSYSGIPANPTGYPSQNYSDFGTAGMYSGTPGFPNTFAAMGGNPYTDDMGPTTTTAAQTEWSPNQNSDIATQGLNSIRQWGGGMPTTEGMMWGDPTWSGIPGQLGTMWGAGLNAPTMGGNRIWDDTVVTATRPESDAPVVQATQEGPDNQPSCPSGYVYDGALDACVVRNLDQNMIGLSAEQKTNLLQDPSLMQLYLQNKASSESTNMGPTSSASAAMPTQGLLGQIREGGVG